VRVGGTALDEPDGKLIGDRARTRRPRDDEREERMPQEVQRSAQGPPHIQKPRPGGNVLGPRPGGVKTRRLALGYDRFAFVLG